MLASAIGEIEVLNKILMNPGLDINVTDEKSGVNSFWIACYYNRGAVMGALANAGIDILNQHNITKTNALHLAIEREYFDIVNMLIGSGYPLDEKMELGLTPLILAARSKKHGYHIS